MKKFRVLVICIFALNSLPSFASDSAEEEKSLIQILCSPIPFCFEEPK